MELYFLGTGAGSPSRTRNVTAIALQVLQERGTWWLFDCGEGTQHQILKSPLRLSRLECVFITHLHGDHVYGLPGLLTSRSVQGATNPITVFGPPGIESFIRSALECTSAYLGYPLDVRELPEPGTVWTDDDWVVTAAFLSHGVPSLGYRIQQPNQPGTLLVDALKTHGVTPGPAYGAVKRGEPIRLPSGEVWPASAFMGPAKAGKTVVILGDTVPVQAAVDLAQGATVLVHESTFSGTDAALAIAYGHSTAVQAAEAARSAGASHLILTHISARYTEDQLRDLLSQATAVFPNCHLAHDGWAYTLE